MTVQEIEAGCRDFNLVNGLVQGFFMVVAYFIGRSHERSQEKERSK